LNRPNLPIIDGDISREIGRLWVGVGGNFGVDARCT